MKDKFKQNITFFISAEVSLICIALVCFIITKLETFTSSD